MLSQARIKIMMNDHVLKKLEEKIIINILIINYTGLDQIQPRPESLKRGLICSGTCQQQQPQQHSFAFPSEIVQKPISVPNDVNPLSTILHICCWIV